MIMDCSPKMERDKMNSVNSLKYTFDKPRYTIAAIKKWRPRGCKTEKEYIESLYRHLRKHLPPNSLIVKQNTEKATTDLVLDGEVVIKIKHNLNTTPKYQRLLDELREYENREGYIILILIGQTYSYFENKLNKHLEDINDIMFPKFFLIKK